MLPEKTNLDSILKLIIKASNQISDNNVKFTFAVYSKRSARENSQQIGSALGIKFNDRNYLITANHVIESSKNNGGVYVIHKTGMFLKLDDISNDFLIDADNDLWAASILNNTLLDDLFISINNSEIIFQNHEYGVSIGYPNSKNKKRINEPQKTGKLTALYRSGVLYNISKPELFTKLGISSEKYILQEHSLDKALDDQNIIIDAINAKGMSGCPLFPVPISYIFSQNQSLQIPPIGILLSERKDMAVLIYIKITYILNWLSQNQ